MTQQTSDIPFKSPYPPPTEGEREVLSVLIEECAEVQQRSTKMERFGVRETQPGQPLDNRARLSREIGDLKLMIELAIEMDLVDASQVQIGIHNKAKQLSKFLQNDEAREALRRLRLA